MTKYTVEVREIEVYIIEGIEAESEEDAKTKVGKIMKDRKNIYKYHSDSYSEYSFYDD